MNNPGDVWHKEVLSPAVDQVLSFLSRQGATRSFYLAGGTALALHFGHRRSVDLDLFTERPFDEDQLLSELQSEARLSVVSKDRQTLHLHVGGVKVSFLGYAYGDLVDVGRGHSVLSTGGVSTQSVVVDTPTRELFKVAFVSATSSLRAVVQQPALEHVSKVRVLSSASPRVLRPTNMLTADGLARPRAPGLGHPGAVAKPALVRESPLDHVSAPANKAGQYGSLIHGKVASSREQQKSKGSPEPGDVHRELSVARPHK